MSDFFYMGGFGLYVWGAMAAVLVYMVIEPVVLILQRRSIIQAIRRARRLEQRQEREQFKRNERNEGARPGSA